MKGHFSVEIRVRNLKGNKRQGSTAPQKITFDLYSPSQLTNLILPVPHRLLVIALRRGILARILTTDELLDGQLTFMKVRDEHLDQLILARTLATGIALDVDTALPASGLSGYLRDRVKKIGLSSVTLYSLKCSATNIEIR